ncbi:unnamed protein product, partial [Anisakis simplex]
PSSYDPYSNVSYTRINKSRRRDGLRSEQDRIYNRPPPVVKKIFLRPNQDAQFKPKQFIWRVWRIPRLKSLIQEAGEFLGYDDGVAECLYDMNGRLIQNENEIDNGQTYILAGMEPLNMK